MPHYSISYWRNLPHIHLENQPIFITYRLKGSIPQEVMQRLKDEQNQFSLQIKEKKLCSSLARKEIANFRKRILRKWDQLLDTGSTGPTWLKQAEIARLVTDAIHHYDGKFYFLVCYCIMPNHVHQLVIPFAKEPPLHSVLRDLKGFTARMANRLLCRTGPFWQPESFDHVVRPGRLTQTLRYILENPVKAGLVSSWEEWPYSYISKEYLRMLVGQ